MTAVPRRRARLASWGALLVGIAGAMGAAPSCAQGTQGQTPPPVTVTVDTSSPTAMPALLRAGVFTFKAAPPAPAMQEWLAETRPGVVEIDIGGPVFQEAVDENDVIARVRRLLPQLKAIRSAGGEPVLAISRIPLWLSSQPSWTDPVPGDVMPRGAIVAPRDGARWATLVAKVVDELHRALGRTPDLKIGWEPDQASWAGSEAEFFAFYRDTVRGIRRADPSARVGGPSVSALFNGKGGEEAPALLPRFLRYCADTPLPDLGLRRLPVDFVVWHQFGVDPVLAWRLSVRQVRVWLKEAGYPESTPLMIGEWASWSGFPRPQSPENDQPALAAYIVATLAAMQAAGIDRAAFTSLLEQREEEGQAFIGSFGLYTNQYIKKPAYWAFAALGRLGDKQLPARSSDPLVAVIAGQPAARETAVLVAASTPSEKSLQRTFIAETLAAGVRVAQLKGALDAATLEKLASGQMRPEDTRADGPLRAALAAAASEVVPLAQRRAAALGRPVAIELDVSGADAAGAAIELWRIDSRNANPQRLQGRIESLLRTRLTDEKQALAAGLRTRFVARGTPDEQIESFTQVMNSRDREGTLARRPPAEQAAVRALADEAQAYIGERLWAIGHEINGWPELAFHADKTGATRDGPRIRFAMEPDSVVLVRILRR